MSAGSEPLPPQDKEFLKERYGAVRFGGSNSRSRTVLALIISIVALPWLVWTAWHQANPEISISPVSYQTIDDRNIALAFDLMRRQPQSDVSCTLIALDIDRNVVGEVDLAISPSQSRIERIETIIPTRLRAVNASAQRCQLATDAPLNPNK